jgi:hypothetical protein
LELTLNLAWLVLSATLVMACRRKSAADRRRAVAVIALVCLIAFLFPVISITDDLNGGAILAETSKQKTWLAGDLAALITASFLAASLVLMSYKGYAISNHDRIRTSDPFSLHLRRRPPPALS